MNSTNRHAPDPDGAQAAQRLIEQELSDAPDAALSNALIRPRLVTVNFAGGATLKCWQVARSNGPYTVIYLPQAGYFSLCVASIFGPVDIGVHGRATDCYDSV
ncbi:MAG: hypothetical protein AB3N23_22545 [Paracoccaceae bacterium]